MDNNIFKISTSTMEFEIKENLDFARIYILAMWIFIHFDLLFVLLSYFSILFISHDWNFIYDLRHTFLYLLRSNFTLNSNDNLDVQAHKKSYLEKVRDTA